MKNLAQALLKSQQEMGSASKDAKNPFFKSNYADLNAFIDVTTTTLNANGIVVSQPTKVLMLDGNVVPVVRTILIHAESGESLEADTMIVCAKQNDPQAYGSAVTYARRYGLQAITLTKAEDDDGNAGSGKEAPKKNNYNTTKTAAIPEIAIPAATAKTTKGFGAKAATKGGF